MSIDDYYIISVYLLFIIILLKKKIYCVETNYFSTHTSNEVLWKKKKTWLCRVFTVLVMDKNHEIGDRGQTLPSVPDSIFYHLEYKCFSAV